MWRYRTAGMFTKKKHHHHSHHHHNNDDDSRRLSEGETLDLAPQEQWLAVILYRCIAQVGGGGGGAASTPPPRIGL